LQEIEQALAPVPGARFAEIPVAAIAPNARQPRQVFDEEMLEELKVSITAVGFLQPIVVRETGEGDYELVMGERRWRAAQSLGLEAIPAIVRDTRDDAMLRDALMENIHRANLNPLEEAAAYQQLLEEFGATHEELAKRIGRSRPQISNTIRLLNLPAPVGGVAGDISGWPRRALLPWKAEQQWRLRSSPKGCRYGRQRRRSQSPSLMGPRTKRALAKRPRPHAPGLSDLAERLSTTSRPGCGGHVGRRKGRIQIEFATVDDLRAHRWHDLAQGWRAGTE
jgi:ParB family chromosome partitioning protein